MKLNISICNTFYSIGLKLGPLSIILYRLFNKFQNLMIKADMRNSADAADVSA